MHLSYNITRGCDSVMYHVCRVMYVTCMRLVCGVYYDHLDGKETAMKIKGMARQRKYDKARYGMRVDGASVRTVQANLAHRRNKKRRTE